MVSPLRNGAGSPVGVQSCIVMLEMFALETLM